ncbi:MAG: hypothetical protein U1D97_10360 [Desulfuromonadales bacterium]|nr:hypothetical protein [Pseudomonadota bacterium]MDZ4185366.1 hypothetical protein [Desulfuromonadales bacterium]
MLEIRFNASLWLLLAYFLPALVDLLRGIERPRQLFVDNRS